MKSTRAAAKLPGYLLSDIGTAATRDEYTLQLAALRRRTAWNQIAHPRSLVKLPPRQRNFYRGRLIRVLALRCMVNECRRDGNSRAATLRALARSSAEACR